MIRACDVSDGLFRKVKATAAIRGVSMKDLIVAAVQKEIKGK